MQARPVRSINEGRRLPTELETNCSVLFQSYLLLWFFSMIITAAATATILLFGNENQKQYIPYHDFSDKLRYSGTVTSVLASWFIFWGVGYCYTKKTVDLDARCAYPGTRTFIGAGVTTGVLAAMWWALSGQSLNKPIPDLPKLVFWVMVVSAVLSLGLLVVGSFSASLCCPSSYRQHFYREKPVLGNPDLAAPIMGDDEEPGVEGSPRRGVSQPYQAEARSLSPGSSR